MDLMCNIVFTATLDITKIKIGFFSVFFKCLFLLNSKATVQLFFKKERKTSGCTAQFHMLILVFHPHP